MGLGLGSYVDGSANHVARRRVLPRLPGARVCSPRRACSRRRSRARSRSWPGSSGRGCSTRCTRRRSTAADIALGNLAWIGARHAARRDRVHGRSSSLFGAADVAAHRAGHPGAVLTGLAFAAPIMAFSATQRTPGEVQRAVPLRDHAAVPVLGHVLSRRVAAGDRAAAGLGHAAVPRGRADARAVAGHDRRGAGPGARPPRSCSSAFIGGRDVASRSGPSARSWCADDRVPAHDGPADRQPPVAAPGRAQPVRLQARLDRHPVGLLRAALLPALRSASGWVRSSARSRDRAASRSRTSCSWRRPCSQARR